MNDSCRKNTIQQGRISWNLSMKLSDIDVLLMLFAITPEERKRCDAASSRYSQKQSRLGTTFPTSSMEPLGKTAPTPFQELTECAKEPADLDDVAQNPES